MSPLLNSIVSLLLWMGALGIAWHHVARRRRLPSVLRWPGFLATVPAAFVLRGLLGEASAALPALAWYATMGVPVSRSGRIVLAALTVSALALYASALGLLQADLYAAGYAPGGLMAPIGIVVLLAYRILSGLAWSWLAGIALFATGLHPSPNLIDALIDVPAVLCAMAVVARRGREGDRPDR
jgi:hypothetical protein